MNRSKSLVLPSKIPWESLKGKELEECIYWLLHAMGARDLQWRVGGTGQGAADQGRDLEATFYSSDPAGEMSQQKWWVEAKGRTGTVEKEAVVASAQNASVFQGVDILVIATNTQFSNPTTDWIKEWNAQKPKPKIRLWDRSTLERHLCAHPEVAARLFARSLSPQGRLEFVRSQFWNQAQPADAPSLRIFWQQRKDLDWDTQARIAVVASEVVCGNICERAWGAAFSDDDLHDTFATALVNGPGLLLRAHEHGKELRGYHETLAYLLLSMLVRFKAQSISTLMKSVWDSIEGASVPQEVRDVIVEPMLNHLEAELFDICQDDCHRVMTDPRILTEKEIENYWDRLHVREPISPAKANDEVFTIEMKKIPCKVGFDTRKQSCPYLWERNEGFEKKLTKLQATVLFRLGQHVKREHDPLKKLL